MSKQPPPAPTASAIGHLTIFKTVGRPGTGSLPRPSHHPTTPDIHVNSYFPYRWSPASLTFNIYFYLFLYLYITRITINNGTPHLKSPKNKNRRAALGRPAIKLLQLVCGRPFLALSSALVPQTLSCSVCVEDS